MAWNQCWTQKKWAPEELHPQAETHFQKFAPARLTQKAEYVRGDSSSSWTFFEVDVCLARYEGTTAKPKGSVALEKESKLNPLLNLKSQVWNQTSPSRDAKALRDAPIFRTDVEALQQWRPIQASHQMELHRLQHRINFIIHDIRKVGQAAAGYQPTDDLQCLQTRISFITARYGRLGSQLQGRDPRLTGFYLQPGRIRSIPTVTATRRIRNANSERRDAPRIGALRSLPSLQRHLLQHHSATERRKMMENVASINGAAEDEGAHAVRLWRTLPLPHQTCVAKSKTRMRRQRRAQKYTTAIVKKCHRTPSPFGSFVSICSTPPTCSRCTKLSGPMRDLSNANTDR